MLAKMSIPVPKNSSAYSAESTIAAMPAFFSLVIFSVVMIYL